MTELPSCPECVHFNHRQMLPKGQFTSPCYVWKGLCLPASFSGQQRKNVLELQEPLSFPDMPGPSEEQPPTRGMKSLARRKTKVLPKFPSHGKGPGARMRSQDKCPGERELGPGSSHNEWGAGAAKHGPAPSPDSSSEAVAGRCV